MQPPGKVQVPGFCDDDTHQDVIFKAAKGLDIKASAEPLSLVMSSGLVKNMPLSSGKPWTPGSFVKELGGAQVRGNRTFGVCLPSSSSDEEEEDMPDDEVYGISTDSIHALLYVM